VTVMAAVSGAGALGAVLVGAVDMCGLFRSSRMSDRSELKVGGNFFCSFPLLSLDFRVSPAVSVDFDDSPTRLLASSILARSRAASPPTRSRLPLLLLPTSQDASRCCFCHSTDRKGRPQPSTSSFFLLFPTSSRSRSSGSPLLSLAVDRLLLLRHRTLPPPTSELPRTFRSKR
jgi:hypothetical protein